MYKAKNTLLTLLFLVLMIGLSVLIGHLVLGRWGIILALLAGVGLFIFSPQISPRLILGASRARKLSYSESPELFRLLEELSRKAHLPVRPEIYLLPDRSMNAMTIGRATEPAIILTEGLVMMLNLRELGGVLAHEISHIRNSDLWILGLANSFRRFTHGLALFSFFFVFFNLPLLLMRGVDFPFGFFFLLITAPLLSLVLQAALSRTREFEADRLTVQLSGDAEGFASALRKIEYRNLGLLNLIFGYRREAQPFNLLRTHPSTEERIRRILDSGKRNPSGRFFPPEITGWRSFYR